MPTVDELYANGQILMAAELLKEQAGNEATAEEEGSPGNPLLHAAITRESEQIEVALAALEDRLTWRCARDKDGMLAHVKQEGGVLSLCFETTYDVPAAWLLAFAREWDLMSAWNKYTSNTEILSVPHLLQALVYGELWLPWPLSNRSVMFTARGIDLLDEKGCVLALYDNAHDPFSTVSGGGGSSGGGGGGKKGDGGKNGDGADGDQRNNWMPPPSTDASCVRADVLPPSCLRMVPLPPLQEGGTPRTRATMLVVCDPKVIGVPDALLSFVFGIVTPWVDAELKSQFLEFGDVDNMYAKRIAANRALYGLTDDRCTAFLEAQKAKEAKVQGQGQEQEPEGC